MFNLYMYNIGKRTCFDDLCSQIHVLLYMFAFVAKEAVQEVHFAMAIIENNTCIKFKEITVTKDTSLDYIQFILDPHE